MNPFKKARTFYYEHKGKIHFTAGVTAGVAGTLYCFRTVPKETNLVATPEMLQQLIDHPSGAMWWTRRDGTTIRILNELHDQIQEGVMDHS